ncbi:hypothetical protein DUI87_15844 [Hirundo rustica rustica]|uniref:Uncharacterized protein n=1 Tax=Hirundo rustica rustica TaxID=333673 RepID=A0A3M0K5R0_HIRRU|nr:hypothetical protein DUI87_15844 [Hirundo rustica rustica]
MVLCSLALKFGPCTGSSSTATATILPGVINQGWRGEERRGEERRGEERRGEERRGEERRGEERRGEERRGEERRGEERRGEERRGEERRGEERGGYTLVHPCCQLPAKPSTPVAVGGLQRKLYGVPIATLQYLKEAYSKAREGIFIRNCSDRTRSNGYRLKDRNFRLDFGKKFFTVRVVRYGNRLPREAVDDPDSVLGHTGQNEPCIDTPGGWDSVQRDLGKKWAHGSLVEFEKTKCKVLHLDQDNPCYRSRLGHEWIRSSPVKKDLGCCPVSLTLQSKSYFLKRRKSTGCLKTALNKQEFKMHMKSNSHGRSSASCQQHFIDNFVVSSQPKRQLKAVKNSLMLVLICQVLE